MTQQPTGHDLALQAAADSHRESALSDLARLVHDIPLLEELAHGRVRGIGFASDRELAEQGRRHVEERRQRRALEIASKGDASGYGPTAAPGNLTAIDALAQINSALTHIGSRVHTLGQAGTNPAPPGTADTLARAEHLTDLVHDITSLDLLRRVAEAATRTANLAALAIDGNPRIKYHEPCPWCGHDSLVLTFNDGLATCTGTHPCICSGPLCECKRNPTGFRHTWHRDLGARAGSWWSLVDLVNSNVRLQEDHMIAQKLLDLVDQLHTPSYELDGVQRSNYGLVYGDDNVPAGHQCRLPRPALIDINATANPRWIGDDDPDPFFVCSPEPDDPDSSEHVVLCCVTCGGPDPDSNSGSSDLWPCDTHSQAHALYETELDHIEKTRGHRWRTILTGSTRTRTRTRTGRRRGIR